jgi:hypothetical protein
MRCVSDFISTGERRREKNCAESRTTYALLCACTMQCDIRVNEGESEGSMAQSSALVGTGTDRDQIEDSGGVFLGQNT